MDPSNTNANVLISNNSATLAKLSTPPSLVLSPSSADSPSETTPSALNSSWKPKSADKQFHDDPSPIEQTQNPATSNVTLDESVGYSREDSAHSRESSTTSAYVGTQKHDQPHRAYGGPLGPESAALGSLSSERPHSFSGGISQSDLRRLQNLPTKGQPPSPISTVEKLEGPRTSPPRENANEGWSERFQGGQTGTPPRFPTLGEQPTAYPSIHGQDNSGVHLSNQKGDLIGDYQVRSQGVAGQNAYTGIRIDQPSARTIRHGANSNYPMQQQHDLLQQANYMYANQTRHAPLDRALQGYNQGYYDLGSPPPLRRDQQMLAPQRVPSSPHNFSNLPPNAGGDHPSLRGAMSIAMLNGAQGMPQFVGMPTPTNGMFNQQPPTASPMGNTFPNYSGQSFYPPTPGYATPDALSNAMSRMAISPSFNGSVGSVGDGDISPSDSQTGPSANNRKLGLYKTELCRSWEEKGSCRYGAKCQFAHSGNELRKVSRHPKYKTEICRTFWVSGSCPYGKRCCFIHTELKSNPSNEVTNPSTSTANQGSNDQTIVGRDRSPSNASGTGSQPGSRLNLMPTQRDITLNSPADSFTAYQFKNPLRVDTASISAPKVNRPGPLTSNPTRISSESHGTGLSPILPATAGPDFGRQAAARHEVVGYNTPSGQKSLSGSKTNRDSQLRHSFNGTEIGLNIQSPISSAGNLPGPYSPLTPNPAGTQTPTNNSNNNSVGHQRSGSAGQWPVGGSLGSRNSSAQQLVSPSSYISANESASPWGGLPELRIDRKRFSGGTWL